ncbi:unnamed protein product [Rotaria sp. Silwood2]|nr:unnamed protein product [Rotaria sp. Silwood2]CAF2800428.1 unnamed protein product [Rotaria sp. Silwood2]CAF2958172.1 unnamed protein product [Rotaria sp. Silwood2]CAF3911244.1 unnamed protein product [Rotaria sp. Silwood2]CAF4144644.1 unnamed protein product [Rotaria sp. Silwood2]
MDSKSHQCSICKKSFPRPSKLQHHIAYHHEKKFSFECIQCGKAYSNQDHVNRHYRTVHQQENTTTKKFNCMINNCTKTFVNKQNLDRHIRIVHKKTKLKSIKCLYCFEYVESLESHLIAKHNSTSIDKLKCLDCSKEFSSIKSLIHHRIIHTDHPLAFAHFIRLVKGWVTTFEDHERREVDVQWTMNRLLDEIDRKQVFKCDLCDRIFRSLFQLDQHRNSKIHQGEFICEYPNCGKRFLYMRNLRQHFKIHHENISRLSCPMNSCSKTFTSQASICRHLSKCHSPNDIIEQINTKQKQNHHRQSNIQSLLSGFNSRKLNQENEISKQMKNLLKLLLTEDNLVQIPDENMDTSINENSFDQHLLNGYNDIGLVEL